MRILHTSDWHLGASLEEVSREPDHVQFLDWLIATIDAEAIELLLVAGDIFDAYVPSAEAQSLYYRFLHRLAGTGLRQVVLVGGNHDSPARLDAPRELLGALGIHVVGGLAGPQDLDRCLCPVNGPDGAPAAVVAAVPFVNEWRLGFRPGDAEPDARMQALGAPFQALYATLAERAAERWPGLPLIGTGHLALLGSEKDDAPLEIHLIGSIGGLPTGIFGSSYAYVALGHIHRGYKVGGTPAWYCGTPLALNVKEGLSRRKVNIVDLAADGSVAVKTLEIPGTRRVLQLSAGLEQIREQLAALEWTEALAPMVKVEVQVPAHVPGLEAEIRTLVEAMARRPVLVGVAQRLPQTAGPGAGPEPVHQRLDELTPRDVFRMLCEARQAPYEELRDAFELLLAGEVAE